MSETDFTTEPRGRTEEDADWTVTADEPAREPGDPVVELEGVRKAYGATAAVRDVSLSVQDGELLTLVGPSGCGKTTTLRLLAGLEAPTAGEVRIRGRTVANADRCSPPEQRDVGIVFQDYALFPHMTVAENVAFGIADAPPDVRDRRVTELLSLVDLPGYGDRSPDELSGGEKQRVALARALAPEPEILLLDEPFSDLDAQLRVSMREEVRAILKEAGVTAVSVTHDQEEALSISDRVAVLHDGALEQAGTPEGVFQHPESRFVAGFLGHASFLSGEVVDDGVWTSLGQLNHPQLAGETTAYAGAAVDVLVRPDDLRARPDGDDGEVIARQYEGATFRYRVELESGDVVECLHNHAEQFGVGERVGVDLVADHTLAWFPA
jgi:iron(III) transport system ATP-binding protein